MSKKAESKKAEPKNAESKKAEPKNAESKKAEPKNAEPKKLTIAEIKKAFHLFDVDNSNSIEVDEVENCLESFGIYLNENEIFELIKKFDADNSGTIEFKEFINLYAMAEEKSKQCTKLELVKLHPSLLKLFKENKVTLRDVAVHGSDNWKYLVSISNQYQGNPVPKEVTESVAAIIKSLVRDMGKSNGWLAHLRETVITKGCEKCALLALKDGNVWAQNSLTIRLGERRALAALMRGEGKDTGAFLARGKRYKITFNQEGLVRGRGDADEIYAQKNVQTVVVCAFPLDDKPEVVRSRADLVTNAGKYFTDLQY